MVNTRSKGSAAELNGPVICLLDRCVRQKKNHLFPMQWYSALRHYECYESMAYRLCYECGLGLHESRESNRFSSSVCLSLVLSALEGCR